MSIIPRYTVEWIGREGIDTETHEEYLNNFIAHFYKNIVKLVDRAMRKEDSSAQGQIVTEILQHLHACNNSVKVFYGRDESLERIENYMLNYSEKPLVLYGEVWTLGFNFIFIHFNWIYFGFFTFREAVEKRHCWQKVLHWH